MCHSVSVCISVCVCVYFIEGLKMEVTELEASLDSYNTQANNLHTREHEVKYRHCMSFCMCMDKCVCEF